MLYKKWTVFLVVLGLVMVLAACVNGADETSKILSSDQSSYAESYYESSYKSEDSSGVSSSNDPSSNDGSNGISKTENSSGDETSYTEESSGNEDSSGEEESSYYESSGEESSRQTESSAPESSKAPAESSKAPAESSKAPAESSKTPAESSKTPAESSKTPAESSKTPAESSKAPAESSKAPAESSAPSLPPLPPYQVKVPVASGKDVYEKNGVIIDYSNASQGYVMVRTPDNKDNSYKVMVVYNDDTTRYNYTLKNYGEYEVIPLPRGNGKYNIIVGFMFTETKLQQLASYTVDVKLSDANISFLYPGIQVKFSANSLAVKKAKELSARATTQAEIVNAVFNFIADTIVYDDAKAANPPKNYIPDPDTTLSTKKGICSDYASLMAAMLRSNGIPTRYVVGDVKQGGVEYRHAWNEIFLNGKWNIIGVYFDGVTWKMADTTFAAGMKFENYKSFISVSGNYTSIYKE